MDIANWSIVAFALALGLIPSLVALFARYELRIRRLKALLEVYRQFGEAPSEQGVNSTTDDEAGGPFMNPVVEFVKNKYTADLPSIILDKEKFARLTNKPEAEFESASPAEKATAELQLHIENAEHLRLVRNWRLIVGALAFGLASSVGFYGFLVALLTNFRSVLPSCAKTYCLTGVDQPVLVIGAIVFVGGYVAAMRLIIQAVTLFDLTGYSFVRQGGEVLFSVLLGMLIYKAFPDPLHAFGRIMIANDTAIELAQVEKDARAKAMASYQTCLQNQSDAGKRELPGSPACSRILDQAPAGANREIAWYWIMLAAVFGLVPASSSRYLLMKAQGIFRWTKTTDERFADIARVTPVDILDGIDFETRYRLEECGLRDVQNLACANPVMLAVESPYNLHEIIDWIGQAQLCHIVGLERYMLLREYNVRTIFDLERAIDSENSPNTFDTVYGSILLSPTDAMKTAAETTKIKFLIDDGKAVKHVSLEEFTSWAYERISRPGASTDSGNASSSAGSLPAMSQAIEHMVYWISDDLHVRRLRRLWIDIEHALRPDSAYFSDSRRRRQGRRSGNLG